MAITTSEASGNPSNEVSTEHPYVTRRPGVLGSRPIVAGQRIPVWQIAQLFRDGRPVEEIVAGYASRLPPAAVYDAISYYHDHRDEIDQEIWQNTSAEALDQQMARLGGQRDERGAVRFTRQPDRPGGNRRPKE